MKAILLPTLQGVRFLGPKSQLKSILSIVFSTLNDLIRTHLMVLSSRKQHRTKVEKLFLTSLSLNHKSFVKIQMEKKSKCLVNRLNLYTANFLIGGVGEVTLGVTHYLLLMAPQNSHDIKRLTQIYMQNKNYISLLVVGEEFSSRFSALNRSKAILL